MDSATSKIAVLVDGDNAQAKLTRAVLEEVSKYGKATIRRIYGDWTMAQMGSWKNILNEYSFNPVQKFNYTFGKNSTDSALIIDAMDILHSKNVEGFCIVSSDSDYTGLAKRIREEGLFVMGIGEKKTPSAFVQSCDLFTYTENLTDTIDASMEEPEENSDDFSSLDGVPIHNRYLHIIDKAFEISTRDDDETYLSRIGANIHRIDPSFDPRTYGFASLSKLIACIPKYEIVKNMVNGLNYPLVKLK